MRCPRSRRYCRRCRRAHAPRWRVTKVMGQTGAVDHVRITAEQCADLATDLGDFQRMRQSGAGEIVGTGNQNLAFRAQTPQSGRMNQSRAIAFESRARLGFGRLGCPPLLVEGAVALIAQHLFPIQSRFHNPSIEAFRPNPAELRDYFREISHDMPVIRQSNILFADYRLPAYGFHEIILEFVKNVRLLALSVRFSRT